MAADAVGGILLAGVTLYAVLGGVSASSLAPVLETGPALFLFLRRERRQTPENLAHTFR